MQVASGTHLGPYQIVGRLGSGGMGEVYRALDTRLGRTVAIKVLPSKLSGDDEAKRRFAREARVISSISHPHICQIYDIGRDQDTDYLVMEYLEGETLSDRLRRGALSVEQVLAIGTQISDALDKAHRLGIVHRDVKPGNIMLTKSGAKLMDFGLAKPPAPAMVVERETGSLSSPTVAMPSSNFPVTQQGFIIGTFQYMAPETLQCGVADGRSDIFSFGCVLYEMLTGKAAFSGKSQISVLVSILEHEPEPITALKPSSPPALDRVVRACLSKDPDQRLQSAHDLGLQLNLARDLTVGNVPKEKPRWLLGTLAAGALLGLAALIGALVLFGSQQPSDEALTELSIVVPPSMAITPYSGPVISPDGRSVVYSARSEDGVEALYLRRLDLPTALHLDGTERATYPFWAPNSASIAFFTPGKLKRIDLRNGVVQPVADAPDGRGGSWSQDDVILFAPHTASAIFRVPATGGKAEQLTELSGSQSHRWPSFLEDGKHFVYTAQPGGSQGGIFLASIDDPHGRRLTGEVMNGEVANGHLLFGRASTLVAAKVDVKRAALVGDLIVVAEHVRTVADRNLTLFSAAQSGAIAYAPGDNSYLQLGWFGRNGQLLSRVNATDIAGELDLSRDNRRLLIDRSESSGGQEIVIIDLKRGGAMPVSNSYKTKNSGVWSPTGESIVYNSDLQAGNAIVRTWLDGWVREDVLLKSNGSAYPDDWSADGRWIIYEQVQTGSGPQATQNFDLVLLDMNDQGKPKDYLRTSANETHARISPDGRWLAYASDESGRVEVYVQSFPAIGRGKWQISTSGGDQPYWRSDSRELYYLAPDLTLMAVPIEMQHTFDPGAPVALFKTNSILTGVTGNRNMYVASNDGQRFLIQHLPEQAGGAMSIVLNWRNRLKGTSSTGGR